MKQENDREINRLRLKYAVAQDLGLLPRVLSVGWPGLTAEETGRIGGVLARRLREEQPHERT